MRIDLKDVIRKAITRVDKEFEDEPVSAEPSTSEKVADRMSMIYYPERALEIKRERIRQQIQQEALSGNSD